MNWQEFNAKWGARQWPPLQVPWELWQLMDIFLALRPKLILEIGCWAGGTLGYWLDHSPDDARVIGVDVTTEFLSKEMLSHPKLKFILGASNKSETIKMVKKEMGVQMLDFVFIDGWHENRVPIEDFDNYSKLVRPGGIVAMHDVISATLPVKEYWKELQARGLKTQTITDGSPESMGIGIIYC